MKLGEPRVEHKQEPTPVGRAARRTTLAEAQGQLAWLRRAVLQLAKLHLKEDDGATMAKLMSSIAVLEHHDKENYEWHDDISDVPDND